MDKAANRAVIAKRLSGLTLEGPAWAELTRGVALRRHKPTRYAVCAIHGLRRRSHSASCARLARRLAAHALVSARVTRFARQLFFLGIIVPRKAQLAIATAWNVLLGSRSTPLTLLSSRPAIFPGLADRARYLSGRICELPGRTASAFHLPSGTLRSAGLANTALCLCSHGVSPGFAQRARR
jgi:hypothetical protein